MPFMLLIAEPRGQRDTRTRSEGEALYARMVAFSEALAAEGKLIDAHALTADTNAARVQVREGRTNIVDGPFAEAKEQLGGFYLVEAADLDEAIDLAKKVPVLQDGAIEIRPLLGP